MSGNLLQKLNTYVLNIQLIWALCLIFNIITFLFIFFKIHPGSQTLTLHYNVLAGVEWYGQGRNLYLLPLIGLIIFIGNFILYRKFKASRIFFAPLCLFVALCAEIILLTASMFLATVN